MTAQAPQKNFSLHLTHTVKGRKCYTRVGAVFLNETRDGSLVVNIRPDFDIVLKAADGAVAFPVEPKSASRAKNSAA